MNAIDEYVALRERIRMMQDRAEVLREGFLRPNARLRSNQAEVLVKLQNRRVFLRDRLPQTILADPTYWEERQTAVVTTRSLVVEDEDDLQLTEPF